MKKICQQVYNEEGVGQSPGGILTVRENDTKNWEVRGHKGNMYSVFVCLFVFYFDSEEACLRTYWGLMNLFFIVGKIWHVLSHQGRNQYIWKCWRLQMGDDYGVNLLEETGGAEVTDIVEAEPSEKSHLWFH